MIYHEVPPSDHKTPYKYHQERLLYVNMNRSSMDRSQDLNWSSKIQGFTTPSDVYTSTKKNLKADINRYGDEGKKE